MQNFTKTIISAVKAWTEDKFLDKERFVNSVADWNENDSGKDSYIKNRTHYMNGIDEYIMFEGYVDDYSAAEGSYETDITNAKEIVLYFNDNIVGTFENNNPSITPTPELSIVYGNNTIAIYNYGFGSGVFKIVAKNVISELKTLDDIFIPDTIVRTDVIRKSNGGVIINDNGTSTVSNYGFASGRGVTASGEGSHAEGLQTVASGEESHAEGLQTVASGAHSHAEGLLAKASNNDSHAEGYNTTASGDNSHAEGAITKATSSNDAPTTTSNRDKGYCTHAEGYGTVAYGAISHAEGHGTKTYGAYSHAEGHKTKASGEDSHAEGRNVTASGDHSHAEGSVVTASGSCSHAEGIHTTALGDYSHSEGGYTTTSGAYSHVQGRYNVVDSTTNDIEGLKKYAHIVGNGTSDTNRSNAHTLDWNGVGWFQGGLQVGGTAQDNGAQTVMLNGDKEIILASSTEGSTKKFKLTIDDDGVLTASEIETTT